MMKLEKKKTAIAIAVFKISLLKFGKDRTQSGQTRWWWWRR